MALNMSVTLRNARLDAIETVAGASAILKMRTGAKPANCAAADSGTVVATLSLPSDWMSAAASGVKALLGTWADANADAAGTIAHFRLYDSGGSVCHLQGTVTITGGGGDLEVDNPVLEANQPFSVTTFSITEGNS